MRRLQDIIVTLIKKQNLDSNINGLESIEVLESILGDNCTSYISKKYFKDGIIYLYISSSVLRSEISYKKKEIICQINNRLNQDIVKDIFFK